MNLKQKPELQKFLSTYIIRTGRRADFAAPQWFKAGSPAACMDLWRLL